MRILKDETGGFFRFGAKNGKLEAENEAKIAVIVMGLLLAGEEACESILVGAEIFLRHYV